MRTAKMSAIPLLLATVGTACTSDSGPDDSGRVSTNGVEIAYRAFGPGSGEAFLFIQGVGGTMPDEPDRLLQNLVDAGYRVIVFDNRDSGQSTHLDEAGPPDYEAIGAAVAAGEPPPLPYTLRDMANDAVAVLDELQVAQAHLIGGSAGGMIAQLIAADHPARVASLTLISSSTNNPELLAGDESLPEDGLPDSMMRQGLAVGLAGDLRAAAGRIEAPTLVVHGTEDELFPLAHGRDLAASIPGARLEIIEGMGHVPEDPHWNVIAPLIDGVIAQADTATAH